MREFWMSSSPHMGCSRVLVGGSSQLERQMADEILSLTKAHPVDALGDDLRRLVVLLDGSVLTVSPDTGPLHISRALDTPVVGIYGYTNPKRTGPYRRYYDLVVDGYAEFPGEEYPISAARRDGMKASDGRHGPRESGPSCPYLSVIVVGSYL